MMPRASLNRALEQLRYVIFVGEEPEADIPLRTHEQYVQAYEQQLERDPAKERRLIEKYSEPLLPIYKKQREQEAKLERLFSGNDPHAALTDEETLEELYDEIANLETESEWIEFKKTLLGDEQ